MQYENPLVPEGINTTDEHPLKEFAILSVGVILVVVFFMGLITLAVELSARFVPFEYEQQMVSSVLQKDPSKSTPQERYLQALADKIAQAQELPKEMVITVHYEDDDIKNAFATLGGHVFIHRGLVEQLSNENALELLLAHEIAHIKYRHPLKSLGSGLLMQIFWAIISGSSDPSALASISQLTSLSYSRSNETQADEEGLYCVFQLHHDVNGASELFQALIDQQSDSDFSPPKYLSTHPDLAERIIHLKKLAIKKGWSAQKKIKPLNLIFKKVSTTSGSE